METAELEKESTALTVRAASFGTVETSVHYTEAIEVSRALRAMRRGVEEFWSPLKQKAHATWKELCSTERKMLEPLETAQKSLDAKISSYLQREEQERLKREQEAKEALFKAEQDRALAEAAHLSELGQNEEADRVLEQAITNPKPAVSVASSVPKINGVSQRITWTYRITDASLIPREYLVPDAVKIGQIVRAMKNLTKIPGIEVVKETGISARS